MLNKNTKVFGSFSACAGNVGCTYFNAKFTELGIDAIYKSFSIEDIKEAVSAARCLNFSGFAVSMPYKTSVLEYVDQYSPEVHKINAANTVINEKGTLIAYNTDYYAAYKMLAGNEKKIVLLGNGGLAKAVNVALRDLQISSETIIRKNWEKIRDIRESLVVNCTPVGNLELDPTNTLLDCRIGTETGNQFARYQAQKQLELYLRSIST